MTMESQIQTPYQTKGIPFQIKDIDFEKRKVAAYFSIFNTKDLDGDIIQNGAFNKTFKERGVQGTNLIQHLKNHNPTQAPGLLIELNSDITGAYFISQLSKSTLGTDTLIEYQEGIIKQHSFGFDAVKEDAKIDANYITEIKLYEVSTLTFLGANPYTRTISIMKNLKSEKQAIELIETLEKYLQIGKFSDELMTKLENTYKLLNTYFDKKPLVDEPQQSTQKDINTLKVEFLKEFKSLI